MGETGCSVRTDKGGSTVARITAAAVNNLGRDRAGLSNDPPRGPSPNLLLNG